MGWGVVAGLVAVLAAAPSAHAVDPVTSSADSGPGSLREAVSLAVDGDTITFAPGVNPVLTAALPIDKPLTLRGNGAASTVIRQTADGARVLTATQDLTLERVGITGGRWRGSSAQGGGVWSSRRLTVIESEVFDNLAEGTTTAIGGGLHAKDLVVRSSTIAGNTARSTAGGLAAGGGLSTSVSTGGAVSSGSLEVVSSTITGNQASTTGTAIGGGIAQLPDSFADRRGVVVASTVAENAVTSAGAGSRGGNVAGVRVEQSIVTGGRRGDVPDECDDTTSGGDNVLGLTSCGATPADAVGAQPLAPLALEGGPTRVRLPQGGPAVDRIAQTACSPATDQRGRDRPTRGTGRCEAGAVEVSANAGPALDPRHAPAVVRTDDVVVVDARGTDPDGGALRTSFVWLRDGVEVKRQGPGAATTSSLDLRGDAGARGQAFEVRVVTSDGVAEASSVVRFVVADTPPVLAGLALGPASPVRTASVTAVPGAVTDADGEPAEVRLAWSVGGRPVAAGAVLDLTAAGAAGGEEVRVTATPTGTGGDGVARTAAVVVAADPPGTPSKGGTVTRAALSGLTAGRLTSRGVLVTHPAGLAGRVRHRLLLRERGRRTVVLAQRDVAGALRRVRLTLDAADRRLLRRRPRARVVLQSRLGTLVAERAVRRR